ncbi:unnamed protein product [Lepeophtheirus salmonis]|uniref:(salmon louse) hypothetical protein n=1 Tax=Lepeophtheirus salmonis TaxID=72036 RepID=A0A7R8CH65_LEPSM|nr:unnamed protein product [Lepeophtheirus salmonis]CAF2821976.1 unnamed protein product [Lepeophtheirus salmonis]
MRSKASSEISRTLIFLKKLSISFLRKTLIPNWKERTAGGGWLAMPNQVMLGKSRGGLPWLITTTTLVSYLPKKNKNVVLLSTLHRDGSISDRDDRKTNHNYGLQSKQRRGGQSRHEASAQIVKAFQSAGLPDRPDNQASTSTFNASRRKKIPVLPKREGQ